MTEKKFADVLVQENALYPDEALVFQNKLSRMLGTRVLPHQWPFTAKKMGLNPGLAVRVFPRLNEKNLVFSLKIEDSQTRESLCEAALEFSCYNEAGKEKTFLQGGDSLFCFLNRMDSHVRGKGNSDHILSAMKLFLEGITPKNVHSFISLSATSDGEGGHISGHDIGAYVWATKGFVFADKESLRKVRYHFKRVCRQLKLTDVDKRIDQMRTPQEFAFFDYQGMRFQMATDAPLPLSPLQKKTKTLDGKSAGIPLTKDEIQSGQTKRFFAHLGKYVLFEKWKDLNEGVKAASVSVLWNGSYKVVGELSFVEERARRVAKAISNFKKPKAIQLVLSNKRGRHAG